MLERSPFSSRPASRLSFDLWPSNKMQMLRRWSLLLLAIGCCSYLALTRNISSTLLSSDVFAGSKRKGCKTESCSPLKLSMHITFFYAESLTIRLRYLAQVIAATQTYGFHTDVFVHTNQEGGFAKDMLLMLKDDDEASTRIRQFVNATNVTVIYHNLTNEHSYFLSWKCRDVMRAQRGHYDFYMYVEDDIVVSKKAIDYWLDYKDTALSNGYNVGFVRIEVDEESREFVVDVIRPYGMQDTVSIRNETYVLHTQNYCGMWIVDNATFWNFTESPVYDLKSFDEAMSMPREASAWGLNYGPIHWYKGVVIPLVENYTLHPDSRIYHLPNNYLPSSMFSTIRFSDIVQQ
ncbi:hypothetical protein ACHAW6_011430 [Cyclotella cf. meneghiniana]